MNVLVYTGSDVSSTFHQHTLSSIRSILAPNYAVQAVNSTSLASHPWSKGCAMLVMPPLLSQGQTGTPESPFNTAAAQAVQKYVVAGGRLLSLGNVARVSPAQTRGLPDTSSSSKLSLEDEDRRIAVTIAPSTDAPASADVQVVNSYVVEGLPTAGSIDLTAIPDLGKVGVEVLARYPSGATVAGANIPLGQGVVGVWTLCVPQEYAAQPGIIALLRSTIDALGLQLSMSNAVARPTPQVLCSAPWRPGVVEHALRSIGVSALTHELADKNDTFLFHSQEQATAVFEQQRVAADTVSDDSTTWNPKHIVVYPGAILPATELTPRFNITAYYEALADARKGQACPDTYEDDTWGVGEALLYGEVVTSTQTMLDKNTHLLTSLPTPLVSLASMQLTGRGRGANVWLSPPGCLQFSLLLRAPLLALPGSRLVFVQYLAALVLADACRDPAVLGTSTGDAVRIKWPNDIYAITQDGERKKIGGILVNTSFGQGKVEIVVGCGLNVLNPPPILSLGQLARGSAAPPTMERTFAAIMARFELKWSEFLAARGSFEPFMDEYLERWLHSDELVTLTTVSPARKVRIVGITPEHGLLRTMAEPDAFSSLRGGGGPEFFDLQPDGNSFDLLAGLIKTKGA
ncbi:class II aaRS and biotin synthetase [Epithele typhae]|uniref:class II aaRS and biotin synthetase n=1 Tax=Epithele typhae TaxID=378194 RepID=UPI002007C065|nr:class II aaRS and biotin synthetase [Epithele typhae]KAH9937786.1 class II aaRS and biotin synthetase [Epithele typhae]